MNNQALILYVLRAILGIAAIFIANTSLNYFNQKPLGMQTVLDQTLKETIYHSMIALVSDIILDLFVEYATLTEYWAVCITFVRHTIMMAAILHYSVILVIRYMSVFHQNILDNIGDAHVMLIARIFTVIVAMLSIMSSDLENTNIYHILIKKEIENENRLKIQSKPWLIGTLITLTLLISTQYMIEMYKREGSQLYLVNQQQIEQSDNCRNNDRNVFLVVFFSILFVFYFLIRHKADLNDLYINRLAGIALHWFLLFIFIPLTFIYSTENFALFFKSQILNILKYCTMFKICHTQIEPMYIVET